jgi:hypothetical protein
LRRLRADESDSKVDAQLRRYATSDDPVGLINRGHQYLQRALRQLVYSYVPSPEPAILKMKFDRVFALARTLAMLTDDEIEFLKLIDGLRNLADHDDAEPTPEHEVKARLIWSHISFEDPGLATTMAVIPETSVFPSSLAMAILSVFHILDRRARRIPRLVGLPAFLLHDYPWGSATRAVLETKAAKEGKALEEMIPGISAHLEEQHENYGKNRWGIGIHAVPIVQVTDLPSGPSSPSP